MIVYRDAEISDGPGVAAMAAASFIETFAHLYAPHDLSAFLDATFGPNGLPAQIADPAYRIRLACDGEAVVGFAKLGPNTLPDPTPRDAAELKQLYVLGDQKGTGVGKALMDWVMDTARAAGATRIALSVFSENVRAQRFYARYGFVEIGAHGFRVGDQIDDDRIWMAPL